MGHSVDVVIMQSNKQVCSHGQCYLLRLSLHLTSGVIIIIRTCMHAWHCVCAKQCSNVYRELNIISPQTSSPDLMHSCWWSVRQKWAPSCPHVHALAIGGVWCDQHCHETNRLMLSLLLPSVSSMHHARPVGHLHIAPPANNGNVYYVCKHVREHVLPSSSVLPYFLCLCIS